MHDGWGRGDTFHLPLKPPSTTPGTPAKRGRFRTLVRRLPHRGSGLSWRPARYLKTVLQTELGDAGVPACRRSLPGAICGRRSRMRTSRPGPRDCMIERLKISRGTGSCPIEIEFSPPKNRPVQGPGGDGLRAAAETAAAGGTWRMRGVKHRSRGAPASSIGLGPATASAASDPVPWVSWCREKRPKPCRR